MQSTMNPRHHSVPAGGPARGQRGAALLVALIFLVLLTVLALGAAGTSLLQEKMVSATRNAQLADWGAESALRVAEFRIWSDAVMKNSNPGEALGANASDFYDSTSGTSPNAKLFREAGGWDHAQLGTAIDSMPYTPQADEASAKLAKRPRYLIEDLGTVKPAGSGNQTEYGHNSGIGGSSRQELWRITARSTGGNTHVVREAESTFAAPPAVAQGGE